MLICLDMRTGAGCGTETVDGARFCEHCGQNLRFALLLHDAGTLVGRYRVLRVIGYGGFGAIYEALDESGQQVALKETFDTSSISTFQREFAVLSQLKHANLPRYIEMFEAEGNGYLVMEYVPGQSLQEILDNQAELLPESQVLGYALQLCDVLAYLHAQQPPILHRDVKPANIRLTPQGRIKLVDFGLLKQGAQQTRATIRGLGTSGYAPIEQYADNQQATNPRSDVYALAATLYHLLGGKEPPSALNRLADLGNPNNDAFPPLPAHVSPHLKEAISKAMSMISKERFANMAAFKRSLQGTQAVEQSFVSLITGQKEQETPVSAPVSAPISVLNQTAAWLTQSLTQAPFDYVMPSNAKSLPYLPLKASGKILKVTFHSDGTQQSLIGMTKGGIVYQWRVPDGQLLKILSLAVPRGSEVEAMAYSPTGETVATANKDCMIRVWSTQDGQLLHKLRAHGGFVGALAYAPSGNVLASASYHEKTIHFWHVATGKLLNTIDDDKEVMVMGLSFSPSGLYLFGSDFGLSYVWRMGDNKLLRTIRQGGQTSNSIEWNPTGKMLIYAREKRLALYDAIKGELIQEFKDGKDGYLTGVAGHPDDQHVATGGQYPDYALHIFALGKKEPVYFCKAHESTILSLAYSPDGRFLASGGDDKRICLWALDAAYLPDTTAIHHPPLEVVENPLLNQDTPWQAQSSLFWLQETASKRPSNYVEATHELDLPHLVCDAKGKVLVVGYHVDGKQLIGITNEGMLYHWRPQDGKLIKQQPLAGQNQLTCVAISPDYQTVAGAGEDLIVRVWRLEDGELLHELRHHTGEIKALTYTPDGQVLASSGGEDETILFWHVADGKLLRTLKRERPVICLKFSPSGQYLACGSLHNVHIWRIRDKKWIREIEKGCDSEQDISWSADEKLLLCGDRNNVHLWRVADGQEVKRFKGHHNTVRAVAWHPDGQLILSAGADRTVRIWSPLAPHLQHVSEDHKNTIRCVAFRPDGSSFASSSDDGTVRIWLLKNQFDNESSVEQPVVPDSTITQTLEARIQEQPVVAAPTISLTKTAASVPPARQPSVLRQFGGWLTKQLSPHASAFVPPPNQLSLPHLICKSKGTVRDIVFSRDQTEVIGITNEGHLDRWSVQNGQLRHRHKLPVEQTIQLAAISPNEQAVATVTNNVALHIWRSTDGKQLHELRAHDGTIKALAYHPQGDYLASSSEGDQTVRLWHSTEGKLLRTFKPGYTIHSLAFNPKGHLLACGSSSFIEIWNIQTGKLVQVIKNDCSAGQTLQWSPNEQRLLCGRYHRLDILRLIDGQRIQEFKGHPNSINAVAYHPNGELISSGGYDNDVRIWSPTAPHLRHLCKAHKHTIYCLAFSANGELLASGSEDETVRLWKFGD